MLAGLVSLAFYTRDQGGEGFTTILKSNHVTIFILHQSLQIFAQLLFLQSLKELKCSGEKIKHLLVVSLFLWPARTRVLCTCVSLSSGGVQSLLTLPDTSHPGCLQVTSGRLCVVFSLPSQPAACLGNCTLGCLTWTLLTTIICPSHREHGPLLRVSNHIISTNWNLYYVYMCICVCVYIYMCVYNVLNDSISCSKQCY